jgi:hypothetical protein
MMMITGAGFTPGDTVKLSSTAKVSLPAATVDATGAFATEITVPRLTPAGPGERQFTLTATSQADPTLSAAAPFMVANFAVATSPVQATPSTIVRYSFSGFVPGKPIFAHYVRGGKVRVTKRYGIAAAPCGTLKARARLFPGPHPHYGVYRVQFDSSRRYVSSTVPRLVGTLDVFRAFRARSVA